MSPGLARGCSSELPSLRSSVVCPLGLTRCDQPLHGQVGGHLWCSTPLSAVAGGVCFEADWTHTMACACRSVYFLVAAFTTCRRIHAAPVCRGWPATCACTGRRDHQWAQRGFQRRQCSGERHSVCGRRSVVTGFRTLQIRLWIVAVNSLNPDAASGPRLWRSLHAIRAVPMWQTGYTT